MGSMLENGLFAIGQVMRLPVMVLLWGCVIAAVSIAASCLMEALLRRRERGGFRLTVWLARGSVLQADDARRGELPSSLRALLEDVRTRVSAAGLGAGDLENLILEREEQLRSSLTVARGLVRLGPSLGLIGTLIPMGSSLASLAGGNLQAMAGQMVVAFTTTIIGLATGTLAYFVATVRQKWISEAIREQRYLAEHLFAEVEANG